MIVPTEVSSERALTGVKARRIVEAMRESVAEVGIADSTFERVAAKAGVSRGLLHYYFGTKERLLVEVVRRDSRARMEMLDAPLRQAKTVDEVIGALAAGAQALAREHPGFYAVLFELFVAGRRHPDLGRELGVLYDESRRHVAEALRRKEGEGVLSLRFDAETTVACLFALTDGAVLQQLSDPTADLGGLVESATEVARFLLDAS